MSPCVVRSQSKNGDDCMFSLRHSSDIETKMYSLHALLVNALIKRGMNGEIGKLNAF